MRAALLALCGAALLVAQRQPLTFERTLGQPAPKRIS